MLGGWPRGIEWVGSEIASRGRGGGNTVVRDGGAQPGFAGPSVPGRDVV